MSKQELAELGEKLGKKAKEKKVAEYKYKNQYVVGTVK